MIVLKENKYFLTLYYNIKMKKSVKNLTSFSSITQIDYVDTNIPFTQTDSKDYVDVKFNFVLNKDSKPDTARSKSSEES